METSHTLTTASTAGEVSPTTSRVGHLAERTGQVIRSGIPRSWSPPALEFYDFLRTNLQKPSDLELVNRRVLPERGDCGVVETEDWTLHLQVHTTNGGGGRGEEVLWCKRMRQNGGGASVSTQVLPLVAAVEER